MTTTYEDEAQVGSANTVRGLIEAGARRSPDAVALTAPGRSPLAYRGLLAQIDDAADELKARGIGRGDRVAVAVPSGPQMATAVLATASCATCAPLYPAYSRREFDFYLSDLNVQALIVQKGMDTAARLVADERGIPVLELAAAQGAPGGAFALEGSTGRRESLAELAQGEDVALVLHTSGTTSRPKVVPLTHAGITASARVIADGLRLTAADRCLSIMPLFHVHGIIGAMLSSLTAGSSIVCTPGLDMKEFFRWMGEFGPTWYTGVPTMHQMVLSKAPANRDIMDRNPLRFVRSSSAPLAIQTMEMLEDAFGVPVIEAYGMTEASHQIASSPLPPGRRKPGSVGVAAGAEVTVVDDEGVSRAAGEVGEITIRGDGVIIGYEKNDDATASSFRDGWFRTGDQGYLDEDGYLFITGRLSEVISRGGEKISPREVDEVLLGHPAVAEAITFAMPDATLGEDVAAAVVAAPGVTATESEIREFAAEHLAYFKVPKRVVIVDEVPRGPTGKVQRNSLAETLGLIGAPEGCITPVEFVAPRTPMEEALAVLWEQVLGTGAGSVGIHHNFFDMGGNSIMAAQVVARVLRDFGVEMPLPKVFIAPTVVEIALTITQGQAQMADYDEMERLLAELETEPGRELERAPASD